VHDEGEESVVKKNDQLGRVFHSVIAYLLERDLDSLTKLGKFIPGELDCFANIVQTMFIDDGAK
jgi:hypothetical protein